MKKGKKSGNCSASSRSKTSACEEYEWTLNQLEQMPLKQFMEVCPGDTATAGVRLERLSAEALSVDVLQEVAQDPRFWDYDSQSGTGYEKELYVFVLDLAERHGVPCRSVSTRNARDTKDQCVGLSTLYKDIAFDRAVDLLPLNVFSGKAFWFVHPDIVPVLESDHDFKYLLSSPLWLFFKARYYLKGSLSPAEHSSMAQFAARGNTHARQYLDFAATASAVHGKRDPEPEYMSATSLQGQATVLSNDDLADELGLSWDCLQTLTRLMDSSGYDWCSDYIGSPDDIVVTESDDLDEDDWDQRSDDEGWDYDGYVWKPAVVDMLQSHVALPLAKLRRGEPVSVEEHERMVWTHKVLSEYDHIVKEYMKLWAQQQQPSNGGKA